MMTLAIAYPVTTQPISLMVAPTLAWMSVSATFTMLMSMSMTSSMAPREAVRAIAHFSQPAGNRRCRDAEEYLERAGVEEAMGIGRKIFQRAFLIRGIGRLRRRGHRMHAHSDRQARGKPIF